MCAVNCKADVLYFYDFDFSLPVNAIVTGVELIHSRGGCNQGSYVIDSIYLVYNNNIISTVFKRDSASTFTTDTIGGSTDLWGGTVLAQMVNSNGFGIYIHTTGTGICTFAQSDIRLNVYYTFPISTNEKNFTYKKPIIWQDKQNVYVETHITDEKGLIRIYDITGKIIMENEVFGSGQHPMQVAGILSSGMYIVSYTTSSNFITKKVVIE